MITYLQQSPIRQILALRLLQQFGYSSLNAETVRAKFGRVMQEGILACHNVGTADKEPTLFRPQRQTLEQQKRGLMRRLLTGKTRVKP